MYQVLIKNNTGLNSQRSLLYFCHVKEVYVGVNLNRRSEVSEATAPF